MAITVIGDTTHGTFEELIESIRKLNDTNGIESISVTFTKAKKPLLRLVTTIPSIGSADE